MAAQTAYLAAEHSGGFFEPSRFLSFLQGLYDQANLFIAPLFIGGDGTPVVGELGLNEVGQAKRFKTSKTRRFGEDVMIEGFFKE